MNQDVKPISDRDFIVTGSQTSQTVEKTMIDWERILKDSGIVYTWNTSGHIYAELKKFSAEGAQMMTLRIYVGEPIADIVADITHGLKTTTNDKYAIDPQIVINEFLSLKPLFMEENNKI